MFLFDTFEPGKLIGTRSLTLERDLVERWLTLFPDDRDGDRMPAGHEGHETSSDGRVFERRNGHVQPIAGAVVTIGAGDHDPPATTSDTGFYMICSVVGSEQYREVSARRNGYEPASQRFFAGWEFTVDFELFRN